MTDDPKLRAALGLEPTREPSLPHEKPPRIDMSRCVVYPVQHAQEAMGLFKNKYHVEPTLCVASNIGGKTRIEAWIVGVVPENWSEPNE